MATIRLTEFASGGGCARKLAAEDLSQVLKRLGPQSHTWVDPGVGPFEDAAIVRAEPFDAIDLELAALWA